MDGSADGAGWLGVDEPGPAGDGRGIASVVFEIPASMLPASADPDANDFEDTGRGAEVSVAEAAAGSGRPSSRAASVTGAPVAEAHVDPYRGQARVNSPHSSPPGSPKSSVVSGRSRPRGPRMSDLHALETASNASGGAQMAAAALARDALALPPQMAAAGRTGGTATDGFDWDFLDDGAGSTAAGGSIFEPRPAEALPAPAPSDEEQDIFAAFAASAPAVVAAASAALPAAAAPQGGLLGGFGDGFGEPAAPTQPPAPQAAPAPTQPPAPQAPPIPKGPALLLTEQWLGEFSGRDLMRAAVVQELSPQALQGAVLPPLLPVRLQPAEGMLCRRLLARPNAVLQGQGPWSFFLSTGPSRVLPAGVGGAAGRCTRPCLRRAAGCDGGGRDPGPVLGALGGPAPAPAALPHLHAHARRHWRGRGPRPVRAADGEARGTGAEWGRGDDQQAPAPAGQPNPLQPAGPLGQPRQGPPLEHPGAQAGGGGGCGGEAGPACCWPASRPAPAQNAGLCEGPVRNRGKHARRGHAGAAGQGLGRRHHPSGRRRPKPHGFRDRVRGKGSCGPRGRLGQDPLPARGDQLVRNRKTPPENSSGKPEQSFDTNLMLAVTLLCPVLLVESSKGGENIVHSAAVSECS